MRFIEAMSIVAVVAGVAFFTAPAAASGSCGGDLSPYMVGFYDANPDDEEEAEVFLVNPTSSALEAFVVIFDDEQNAVDCERILILPNDLEKFELDTDDNEEGIVKIVSMRVGSGRAGVPQSGIVGWMRHEIDPDAALADTNLTSLPVGLLHEKGNYELNLIVDYVTENCPL